MYEIPSRRLVWAIQSKALSDGQVGSNANGGGGVFIRVPSGRDSPKTPALATLSTAP
jgi:hypothetical protein